MNIFKDLAESFAVCLFCSSLVSIVVMFLYTVISVIYKNYNAEHYWPKQAMKIMIADSARSCFLIILLLLNVTACLHLIVTHGCSWWLIGLLPLSFPLSGIILTWAARISAVIGWTISKMVQNYLKILQKNWF